MKTVRKTLRLMLRLSTTAAVLLFSQQALAAGTAASTPVDNQATVSYSVNSIVQTPIDSNNVQFLVDRRVDFTITEQLGANTQVVPGQGGAFLEFVVSNITNDTLDFALTLVKNGPQDMNDTRIAVGAPDPVPANTVAAADPGVGGGVTVIDDLPADQSVRVRVYADTPGTWVNGNLDAYDLQVTAADSGGTLLTQGGAWDAATVQNVFANAAGADGSGNATEQSSSAYEAVTAQITVAKTQAVDSARSVFGTDKAIPGAFIEYTITISNASTTIAATGISISDLVDSDVNFVTDAYEGGVSNISFDAGTTFCVADAADANGDGCTWDAGTSTLTIAGSDRNVTAPAAPINVAASGSVTVSFVVEIPYP